MKAARYYGKEDLRIEEVPEPQIRPGTVKIAPAFTGICGSDLHAYFDGPMPGMPTKDVAHPVTGESLPVTLGHEFSGVVEEIGDGVEGLTIGESVVVEPSLYCGECHACRAGMHNVCQTLGFIGLCGGGGGLSEHIVVEAHKVHSIGDIPLDQGALIEPLAVCTHAVRKSGATAGDVAVIGGAGPIGLLTAAVLKAQGVRVVVSEINAERLAMATALGLADVVVNPAEEDLPTRILEITDGRGADVAFECAGVGAVVAGLLASLRSGGLLQVVALYSKDPVLPSMLMMVKEARIQGAMGYANDHPTTIRLVQEGKVNLAPFITRTIAIDDIVDEGFTRLAQGSADELKILVHL